MYSNIGKIVTGYNYKATFKTEAQAVAFVQSANAGIFEQLKAEKIKQLHNNYTEFYTNYVNSYCSLEVESFKDKADEAKAYMRDNTAPTPYVDAMVGGDAILRVAILNAIWAKVSYLAGVEGQLIAKRDAIKACTTQEELDQIDIGFGA